MAVEYVDTYRYLMSALIQVFGAMIPFGFIIGCFRHQTLVLQKQQARARIARLSARIFYNAFSEEEYFRRFADIEQRFKIYETMSDDMLMIDSANTVSALMHQKDVAQENNEKNINGQMPPQSMDLKLINNHMVDFQCLLSDFAYRDSALTQLPKMIFKSTMTCILGVTVFSLLLMLAGMKNNHFYARASIAAVVISFFILLLHTFFLWVAIWHSVLQIPPCNDAFGEDELIRTLWLRWKDKDPRKPSIIRRFFRNLRVTL